MATQDHTVDGTEITPAPRTLPAADVWPDDSNIEFHAQEIYRQALELQAAGIQLLVLECVPVSLAERITKALRIPVIGIGAGPATDGQILVMHDAFGITSGYVPKFTKNFLAETGDMRAAIRLYVQQVSEGTFPGPEHCFN